MELDITKPVQTLRGSSVRILATDLPGKYPIVGVVDGVIFRFTVGGRLHAGPIYCKGDLMNVPQEETRWVNLYRCGEYGYDYPSQEAADKAAAFQNTRVACVKIVFKHGEGLGQ